MTVPPSSGDTHRAPARSDVLAALVALGQDLAGSVTPDRVAAAVAATLHALLDPDALFIVLVDAGGRRAVAHADGVSDPRPDHPLVERVLAEGPLLDARDQHGSWLAVPLRSAEPLGAVCLGLRTPGRFGQDELRLVTAVASQAAIALENRRLTAAISEGKTEWEGTVDAIQQAFCVVDLGGRVRRANRAFSELVEVPLRDLPGQPVLALVPPAWAATIGSMITQPGSGKSSELRARNRILVLSVLPLEHADRETVVLVLDDQTEKRRLQKQLIQSEKMSAIGQLIAGVAHDLNNPLASVIGFADYLLEQEHRAPPELVEPLRAIQQEAERAAAIVHNLLSFARKHEDHRRAVPLGNLLQATLLLLRNQLMAGKIETHLDVPDDLPDVQVDPNQLQQVFVNLITNAAHAMNRGGTITLSAQPWLDGVAVTVRDDGPGIPEEIRTRIFEPFFTTKAEGEGTGLGLSICQGIVKEHGGRLVLSSAAPGGTAFRVELPGTGTQRAEVGEPPPVPDGLRILVVDDEPHIRHYMQATLETWGHRVALAGDGRDALDAARADPFDVVITDLRMPEVGGRDFFEHLTRDHPTLASRVVFSTGDTVRGDTLAFLESLDRPWLRKPFTLNELRAVLAWAASGP